MPTFLSVPDLRDILKGATFLGAGGGGSLSDGLKLLDKLPSTVTGIELFPVTAMKPEDSAVFVAGIGSPKAFQDRQDFDEAITAFRAMQREIAAEGRSLSYIMSGEMGGMNTAVPLYVAAREGLPFLDADGNGRAVPELGTGLFPLGAVPPVPLVMAARNGDSVTIRLGDPTDYGDAENVARALAVAYGMVAAFSTWPVDRQAIESKLDVGGVSKALAVGRALSAAADIEGLATAMQQAAGAKLVTSGVIKAIEVKTEGGFDYGTTFVSSDGPGPSLWIDFKNENMLARAESGDVIDTVPDIIAIVNTDTMEPLSNAETAEGQKVAVFVCRAPQAWYASSGGFDCWKGILGKLGYEGPYTSCV